MLSAITFPYKTHYLLGFTCIESISRRESRIYSSIVLFGSSQPRWVCSKQHNSREQWAWWEAGSQSGRVFWEQMYHSAPVTHQNKSDSWLLPFNFWHLLKVWTIQSLAGCEYSGLTTVWSGKLNICFSRWNCHKVWSSLHIMSDQMATSWDRLHFELFAVTSYTNNA